MYDSTTFQNFLREQKFCFFSIVGQWTHRPKNNLNLSTQKPSLSQLERVQRYMPSFKKAYILVFLAQKPDILHVCRCICSNRDRLGEIKNIFFAVTLLTLTENIQL